MILCAIHLSVKITHPSRAFFALVVLLTEVQLTRSTCEKSPFSSRCFANSMRFGPILSSCKGLTSIILSTLHDCSGATARHFESLPDLEELTIYNCRGVNNDNLRHLQRLTTLKHLNLGKNEVRRKEEGGVSPTIRSLSIC